MRKSGVASEQITLTVWHSYCALCDNQLPDDPRDRIHRSNRSEAGARKELARHREERHIAPWFPDDPTCEGCGKRGPIEATRTTRTADHVDIKWEHKGGRLVEVDRTDWQTKTEQVTERLRRDENVPWGLAERWWHSSCHTAYLADPEREDEIDNRYAERIKEERKWVEDTRALIDQTEEEGVLWGRAWRNSLRAC